jgi:valine--pyruvate aminotransferase
MELSDFGKKMTTDAGILRLMDDLGKALSDTPPLAMFGGGNPAHIPEVTETYKASLHTLLTDDAKVAAMLGNYDTPQGNKAFIASIVSFLNRHYALDITERNVAVTPGSQTGYFMLFNLLAGRSGKQTRKIVFPIVPEYIGYVDQSLVPDSFASARPRVHEIGAHEFKYEVDFDALIVDDSTAGICISRPTNPTGNVITDEELTQLGNLAVEHDIPLIIDNAYGLPFPGVILPDVKLFWNDHTILSISLSKIGLPASRVGVFIGPADLMQALTSANAIVSLASPSFGQYLTTPLIESDEIVRLSSEHIQPYYFERATHARKLIDQHFPADLPWRLHVYEGSYFFWLWLPGSKLSSKQLYDVLKSQGVLVVPGEYFFPGQDPDQWPHVRETIRINFARPDQELELGIPVLADVVRIAYQKQRQ